MAIIWKKYFCSVRIGQQRPTCTILLLITNQPTNQTPPPESPTDESKYRGWNKLPAQCHKISNRIYPRVTTYRLSAPTEHRSYSTATIHVHACLYWWNAHNEMWVRIPLGTWMTKWRLTWNCIYACLSVTTNISCPKRLNISRRTMILQPRRGCRPAWRLGEWIVTFYSRKKINLIRNIT